MEAKELANYNIGRILVYEVKETADEGRDQGSGVETSEVSGKLGGAE